MKDIEVNGAHITDESAEILTQWQTKTEPVSACYIEVIEDLIDFLIEKGDESTPTNEVLRRLGFVCAGVVPGTLFYVLFVRFRSSHLCSNQ